MLRLIAAAAALGTMIAGCAGDETAAGATAGGMAPLELTAGIDQYPPTAAIDGATRAVTTEALQDDGFEAGQTLRLYFSGGHVRQKGSDQPVEWAEMTTGTLGTIQTTTTMNGAAPLAASTPYLAFGEPEAWIDAYHPVQDGAGSSVTNQMTTFTVEQDQSGTAGYYSSDLMYATARAVRTAMGDYSAATAHLQFRHKMARLQVTVKSLVGNIRAVRIIRGYRTVSIDNARVCRLGTELTNPITTKSTGYITMYSDATGEATVTCAALLPPQALTIGDLLLVETAGGNVVYRLDEPKTLEEGNAYTATLSDVNQYAVGSSLTITSWRDGVASSQTTTPKSLPFYVNGVLFNMIYVGSGTLTGTVNVSDIEETSGFTLAAKQYTGYPIDGFYMAETEVTEALWQAVTGDAASSPTLPKTQISWLDITQSGGFLDQLNAHDDIAARLPAGWRFRLPSIAQWVYAFKGGPANDSYTYCGSDTPGDVAWYQANASGVRKPVATKAKNRLGLYDMSGNECEYLCDVETDANGVETGKIYMMGGYCNTAAGAVGNLSWNIAMRRPNSDRTEWRGLRVALVSSWPLRESRVGDLVGSDGRAYAHVSCMPTSVKPVAIVCSKTVSATDAAAGYTGYAMALKAPDRAAWYTTDPGAVVSSQISCTAASAVTTLRAALDGRTETAKVTAYCKANGLSMATAFPAFQAVADYGARVAAAPAGTSGWFMPSIGQAFQWVEVLGGYSLSYAPSYSNGYYSLYWGATASNSISRMNAKLTAAGLSGALARMFTFQDYYQTSTIGDTPAGQPMRVWQLWLESYNSNPGATYLWNTANHQSGIVRPMLAF